MKKLLTAMSVLAVAGVVQAALIDRDWTSVATYGIDVAAPVSIGDPATWSVAIVNLTDDTTTEVLPSPSFGLYGGGYYFDSFLFTETENDNVVMRIYNADSIGGASWKADSVVLVLPDFEGIVAPGATDMTFDFTGSEWEVIPEPATIGLMGIAGLGLYLSRRKVRR